LSDSYRFPYRQLLGWIYLGLGLVATSFVGLILISLRESDFTEVVDALYFGVGLPRLFLSLLSAWLYLPAAYKLLANKGAPRPLIIASSILTVFNGLFVGLFMRVVVMPISLVLLATAGYGLWMMFARKGQESFGLYASQPRRMPSEGGMRLRRVLVALLSIFVLIGVIILSRRFYGRPEEVKVSIDSLKAVQVPFGSLTPAATFKIGRNADWVLVTDDAVWVTGTGPYQSPRTIGSSGREYSVQRIDPRTNTIIAKVSLPGEPCSSLAFGFDSVWVPLCGDKPVVGSPDVVCTQCAIALVRVDVHTNRISATLPLPPEQKRVGITASADSIWMLDPRFLDKAILNRINPGTNAVRQSIGTPRGFHLLFSSGMIWIAGGDGNLLTFVDAGSGGVLGSIPIGRWPQFLTAGGGSIWTLNQFDGTISRVDAVTKKVTDIIAAGIKGRERGEGDIDYGADSVWATVYDTPLTRIDEKTNKVMRQWVGRGGDSLRFGFDSIWLTDYEAGLLLRIPARQALVH
jgi:hypothetical protein